MPKQKNRAEKEKLFSDWVNKFRFQIYYEIASRKLERKRETAKLYEEKTNGEIIRMISSCAGISRLCWFSSERQHYNIELHTRNR